MPRVLCCGSAGTAGCCHVLTCAHCRNDLLRLSLSPSVFDFRDTKPTMLSFDKRARGSVFCPYIPCSALRAPARLQRFGFSPHGLQRVNKALPLSTCWQWFDAKDLLDVATHKRLGRVDNPMQVFLIFDKASDAIFTA